MKLRVFLLSLAFSLNLQAQQWAGAGAGVTVGPWGINASAGASAGVWPFGPTAGAYANFGLGMNPALWAGWPGGGGAWAQTPSPYTNYTFIPQTVPITTYVPQMTWRPVTQYQTRWVPAPQQNYPGYPYPQQNPQMPQMPGQRPNMPRTQVPTGGTGYVPHPGFDINTRRDTERSTEVFETREEIPRVVPPGPVDRSERAKKGPGSERDKKAPCVGCEDKANEATKNVETIEQTRDDFEREFSRLGWGAEKTMAVMYQSCVGFYFNEELMENTYKDKDIPIEGEFQVIKGVKFYKDSEKDGTFKREIEDLKQVVDSHPYIKLPSMYGANCKKINETPVLFSYQGVANYDPKNNVLDLFTPQNPPGTPTYYGISCSQFVKASMVTAGLKVYPNSNNYPISTRTMLGLGLGKNDCFRTADFKGRRTIKAGDVIVTNVQKAEPKDSIEHSMIVETAGPDPFGLDKSGARSLSDCRKEKLSYKNFNFTILHSGSYKNAMGIARYKVQDFLAANDNEIRTYLQEMAVKACKAEFSNGAQMADDGNAGGRHFAIIRHDADKSGCQTDRFAKLKGEDCVKHCDGYKY